MTTTEPNSTPFHLQFLHLISVLLIFKNAVREYDTLLEAKSLFSLKLCNKRYVRSYALHTNKNTRH